MLHLTNQMVQNQCELCLRGPLSVTRHHLIPRARHRRGSTARTFTLNQMRDSIAMLCRSCHQFIHRTLTEKELADGFHTLEALRAHPAIREFTQWLAAKPPGLQVTTKRQR